MWYVNHKLLTDVQGSALNYHTDATIGLRDICKKHRLCADEMYSSYLVQSYTFFLCQYVTLPSRRRGNFTKVLTFYYNFSFTVLSPSFCTHC